MKLSFSSDISAILLDDIRSRDESIFQELQQGNFSRLLFLQGNYTQKNILEALLIAPDTPKKEKIELLQSIVKSSASICDCLDEEYLIFLRRHNDVVRTQLYQFFAENNNWFSSFRSYNNHFWSTYGGRSLQTWSVVQSNHERHHIYCDKIKEWKLYCINLLRASRLYESVEVMDFYKKYGIIRKSK